ncbi:MAG TPA: helix-turn-helix transcriptional regulator [Steroidobacteraceae bacterium]|nr:helix-turn-helix transcriptional regulator [Steroidobacteraceae bacterium]
MSSADAPAANDAAISPSSGDAVPRFMSVRQAANYLQVNEKKIYSLANSGLIPATKLTGKWLFPRDLVDQWLLESSHGGLLSDRMVVAGSDDPVLYRALTHTASELQGQAVVSYATTGTQLGLNLLAQGRADVCGLHWGPATESQRRHPALLRHYVQNRDWVLVRLFRREQGLVMTPGLWTAGRRIEDLFSQDVRWCDRQEGAGSHRFLQEVINAHRVDPADRRITSHAHTERDAASSIAMGLADVAPGIRAIATEFGLDFYSIGWECFDLAMCRAIFFRTLFRRVLDRLRSPECQRLAQLLGGYDTQELGELVWSA